MSRGPEIAQDNYSIVAVQLLQMRRHVTLDSHIKYNQVLIFKSIKVLNLF